MSKPKATPARMPCARAWVLFRTNTTHPPAQMELDKVSLGLTNCSNPLKPGSTCGRRATRYRQLARDASSTACSRTSVWISSINNTCLPSPAFNEVFACMPRHYTSQAAAAQTELGLAPPARRAVRRAAARPMQGVMPLLVTPSGNSGGFPKRTGRRSGALRPRLFERAAPATPSGAWLCSLCSPACGSAAPE